MTIRSLPLHPGAVIGYGVNRSGFRVEQSRIEEARQRIIEEHNPTEPPTDDELAVMLHFEDTGGWSMGLSDHSLDCFWQETEELRAPYFRMLEDVIEETS